MYKDKQLSEIPSWVKEYTDQPYSVRNYDLFAILADVRNGSWGERFIPIDAPRGLPPDVSNAVREESERWGQDGHSHSYFTVRELLDYPWSRNRIHHSAIVDEREYTVWRSKGKPDSYSADVGGPGVTVLDWVGMELLLSGKQKREAGKTYYARVEWDEDYQDSVADFVTRIIPELQQIGNPDDVRIVFWFDN